MTSTDASTLSANAALAQLTRGLLTPTGLLESCISQIEQHNPQVNAVVTSCFDRARAEAHSMSEELQKGHITGPLMGLPVLIKDNQMTAGVRTTLGSRLYENQIPEHDAGIVTRLRRAGAIVLGKTNIPELSIGANTRNDLFGATSNPFDTSLTCGGSSGGSAVAVACNMAPLATGSDHGGSLRIPASYCGVVGYRASPGIVPNEERTTPTTHYSLQGPLARTVADAALMLSVIAERIPGPVQDPMAFPLDTDQFRNLHELDLGSLKLAVSSDLGGLLVSQENKAQFEHRINRISGLFKTCDWHSIDLTDAPAVDWQLRQDVFVSQYYDQAANWPADLNPNVRATYDTALQTSMQDIAIARRQQLELMRRCQALFTEYDLLIVPGMSVPPFSWKQLYPAEIDGHPVENYMAWLALTSSLTVVGQPVVSLPAGLDDNQLPFGLQIVGPMYQDHRLLSAAHALELQLMTDSLMSRPIPEMNR